MDYAHEGHNAHLVVYHVIWCPKRRRKVLVGPVRDRLERIILERIILERIILERIILERIILERIIGEVVAEKGWEIIRLAIQPDHVHLFIRANPSTLPSDIPRRIEGRSSRYLREEFPHLRKVPSLWTRSVLLSTAGTVPREILQKYIERQSKT